MGRILFDLYAEGTQQREISPGRLCFFLNQEEFEPTFSPPELRSLNRLTTVAVGLLRKNKRPISISGDQTSLYLLGDDADPVIPGGAQVNSRGESELFRALRKISPMKEVGLQASMVASRIGAELGVRGKIWAINPSHASIALLLDDYRMSIEAGRASRGVFCVGISFSATSEYWPEGDELRESVRMIGADGWSTELHEKLLGTLSADLRRTGANYG